MIGIIIFERKDYYLVKLILSNFQEFYEDDILFCAVIDNYVNSLIYNLTDVAYYENVLKLFYETNNCNINSKNKKILKNRLFEMYDIVSNNENIKKKDRQRIVKQISCFSNNKETQTMNDLSCSYEIENMFPFSKSDVLSEIDGLTEANCDKKYVDLTHKYVISIDSKGNCIDDAFSLDKDEKGNYILTIYIADVESVVPLNSKPDKEAYKRGFTIYLPDNYIPMFPNRLSTNLLSLNKQGLKKVFAYEFVFTPSMTLKNDDVKIYKAIISVSRNYSYNEIGKVFKKNKKEAQFLSNVFEFSEKLNISSNYFENEEKIKQDLNKNVFATVVAKFMVLTNYFVSSKFLKLNYPFLYYNNDNIINELGAIDLDILQNDKLEDIMNLINTSYLKSFYSTVNKGHLGFGLDTYCHTTNPIRNYASLTIQRLTEQFIVQNIHDDDTIYFWEDYLKDLEKHLNERKKINGYYCSEYVKKEFSRKTKSKKK